MGNLKVNMPINLATLLLEIQEVKTEQAKLSLKIE